MMKRRRGRRKREEKKDEEEKDREEEEEEQTEEERKKIPLLLAQTSQPLSHTLPLRMSSSFTLSGNVTQPEGNPCSQWAQDLERQHRHTAN